MTYLAHRLRTLRLAAQLMLQAASEQAGISLSYLSDVERGRHVPSLGVVERLLALYGYQLALLPVTTDYSRLLDSREGTT